jgi:multicomponent Na+:H+ antiporter subunit E
MRRLYHGVRLLVSFAYQLVLSNIAVARTVLTPGLAFRPGIVRYPTELKTAFAVTWLANLITLTPGTLTLDISPDQRTLFIHALDITDPAAVVASIRDAFEGHLLEIER